MEILPPPTAMIVSCSPPEAWSRVITSREVMRMERPRPENNRRKGSVAEVRRWGSGSVACCDTTLSVYQAKTFRGQTPGLRGTQAETKKGPLYRTGWDHQKRWRAMNRDQR